jgi:hypothetical protein
VPTAITTVSTKSGSDPAEARHSFLQHLSGAACYGDDAWTFFGVERDVQQTLCGFGHDQN